MVVTLITKLGFSQESELLSAKIYDDIAIYFTNGIFLALSPSRDGQ